ncbi:hypothetical protein CDAR_253521 [Caerostris darwini]|uniref:Uncharacterized protein n=1 Tax=Caerostris darwini TaxID=1538125 RepID=A0AAV4MKF4_9ARAC|nr:hypothetical protein CDAR_253521 [Caerostris darwini]
MPKMSCAPIQLLQGKKKSSLSHYSNTVSHAEEQDHAPKTAPSVLPSTSGVEINGLVFMSLAAWTVIFQPGDKSVYYADWRLECCTCIT